MNYLFLNTNFALKLQGKCRKDDVVMFTEHLSVTITRLTTRTKRAALQNGFNKCYKRAVKALGCSSCKFWLQWKAL